MKNGESCNVIIGFGAQMSKLETKTSGSSFEGHLGAQFRFFTGPQAYLNVEPYIGLATDQMDLSENRNWRKTDIFYGINFDTGMGAVMARSPLCAPSCAGRGSGAKQDMGER